MASRSKRTGLTARESTAGKLDDAIKTAERILATLKAERASLDDSTDWGDDGSAGGYSYDLEMLSDQMHNEGEYANDGEGE